MSLSTRRALDVQVDLPIVEHCGVVHPIQGINSSWLDGRRATSPLGP